MDYLQYTMSAEDLLEILKEVLNLVINGLPSIHKSLINYTKICAKF